MGAFPGPDAPQFRNDRLVPVQPLVRIRRPQQKQIQPIAAAPIQQHFIDEAKPVNEEREDDAIHHQQQQQQPFFQPAQQQQQQQSNLEQHLTETVRKVPIHQQQQQQPAQQRQIQLENALAAQRFAAPAPAPPPPQKIAVSFIIRNNFNMK